MYLYLYTYKYILHTFICKCITVTARDMYMYVYIYLCYRDTFIHTAGHAYRQQLYKLLNIIKQVQIPDDQCTKSTPRNPKPYALCEIRAALISKPRP